MKFTRRTCIEEHENYPIGRKADVRHRFLLCTKPTSNIWRKVLLHHCNVLAHTFGVANAKWRGYRLLGCLLSRPPENVFFKRVKETGALLGQVCRVKKKLG